MSRSVAAVLFSAFLLAACGGRDGDLPDFGSGMDAGGADLGAPADLGPDAVAPVDLGADTAPPDCTGTTPCTTSGLSCEGSTRVVCGRDGRGCMVETRTDCAAMTGGTCVTTGGAHCMADPCAGVSTCPAPSRTCEADVLVTCAAIGSGCLGLTREDCTSIGSTCLPDGPPVDGGVPDGGVPDGGVPDGGTGAMAACSAPDPCYLVDPATRCTTAGRTCATATSLDDCHPNLTGCLVTTHTDCLAGASPIAYCDATGTTPTCVDPCLGLTQCAPGDPPSRCDGSRIVTCTTDAAGCSIRTETNCAAMGMGCDPGTGTASCSGDLCPSAIATIDCTGVLPRRIDGNTATSSSVLGMTSCSPTPYPGHEGIYLVTNPVGATAHITFGSRSDTAHAYGIFALDGTASACDSSAPCIASSTAGLPTTIDVPIPAGGRRYVVVDGRDAVATTMYSLVLTCDLCGDSVISPAEQCDDGNTTRGDGCDDSCYIEAGWACGGTPSVCHRTVCGNSLVEPGETCDDGNTTAGDGCSPTCGAETFTAVPASGGTVTITGGISTTDPTFTRPFQDCTTTSGTGGVYYDTRVLQNSGTSPLTVTVTVSFLSFGDGYLFAYRAPFDPTMPGVDCVVGDDDYLGVTSSRVTFTIAPGAQMVIVVTEFAPGSAVGSYSIQIQSM